MAPRKCESEESLESHMRREVQRKLKGRFFKLQPGLSKGIPDRMILLPGGRIFLVELKAEDGTVDPLQKVWHANAAQLGTDVIVLSGREEVDRWISSQIRQRPKFPDEVVIDWTTESVTIDGRPFPWFIEKNGPVVDIDPAEADQTVVIDIPVLALASRVTVIGERPND